MDKSYTYEHIVELIQIELQHSLDLNYVIDDNIVILDNMNAKVQPQVKDYCIRLYAPEGGFLIKTPRIGNFFRNTYSVAVELWLKSSGKVTTRIVEGDAEVKKGIYEFYHDVMKTLEHNTFKSKLDPIPGSNVGEPIFLEHEDSLVNGIGFIWTGWKESFD